MTLRKGQKDPRQWVVRVELGYKLAYYQQGDIIEELEHASVMDIDTANLVIQGLYDNIDQFNFDLRLGSSESWGKASAERVEFNDEAWEYDARCRELLAEEEREKGEELKEVIEASLKPVNDRLDDLAVSLLAVHKRMNDLEEADRKTKARKLQERDRVEGLAKDFASIPSRVMERY